MEADKYGFEQIIIPKAVLIYKTERQYGSGGLKYSNVYLATISIQNYLSHLCTREKKI